MERQSGKRGGLLVGARLVVVDKHNKANPAMRLIIIIARIDEAIYP